MGDPRPSNLAALKEKFEDFDLEEVYDKVEKVRVNLKARNFVVQFGPHKAKIAFDLDTDEIKDLQAWTNDEECPIRWINFWNTTDQKDSIDVLGKHYGFTRRLCASITAWDQYREFIRRNSSAKKKAEPVVVQATVDEEDLEQGLNALAVKEAQLQDAVPLPQPNREEAAYFKVAQSSMNYTTIDHGNRFTCVGANWLHMRPERPENPAKRPAKHTARKRLVPPKHWSWLTLCMSGSSVDTVISIHEAPNLEDPPNGINGLDAPKLRVKELAYLRHNTIAVLQQLSKIGIEQNKDNALSLKAIREPLGRVLSSQTRSSTAIPNDRMAAVGASNLFYYLFEDTLAVVPILHEAKMILENLSQRILTSPRRMVDVSKSTIIPELHDLGKELRLLQHLFESYKILIQTILAPPDVDDSERVRPDLQARDRFRRLGDRLQLLMLNTIKEYLDEKKELSSTYFNLTAQKDSAATARLTQSATLLAKLSVFFLPISFMTSYFSVSIPDMMESYTSNTYWVSFGVIAFLSFASLFFFSRLLFLLGEQLSAVSERIDTALSRPWGIRKHNRDDDDDD